MGGTFEDGTVFDDGTVTAVLRHMNSEHSDDSLLIARAFGDPRASEAVMTGFDERGGEWMTTVHAATVGLRVPWPNAPITERPEVRREIVALYVEACRRLSVEPRRHA